MQRLFTKWWRGGRWLDPPMLLVGFFFAGVWLLWPMGGRQVTALGPKVSPMLVEALPSGGGPLLVERRPDRFVRRSGEAAVGDDGLNEMLLGWLGASEEVGEADVALTADGAWWFPAEPAAPDDALAGEAFESLAAHAALARFHVVRPALRASASPVAGTSTSMVVELSAPLVASGFSIPERALATCSRTPFPWEVTVEVVLVDGGVEDVLVVSGHEDAAINHGVVRTVFRGGGRGGSRGWVTLSWPGGATVVSTE